jgi:hypothetical protein
MNEIFLKIPKIINLENEKKNENKRKLLRELEENELQQTIS